MFYNFLSDTNFAPFPIKLNLGMSEIRRFLEASSRRSDKSDAEQFRIYQIVKMVENMDEMDNPIMMIVTFK